MTKHKRWLVAAAAGACLGLNGCVSTIWEEVSSRDFTVKGCFAVPPDPMYVINNSTDGDKRAKAFADLKEPLTHGGTQKDQDAVVTVLIYAAANDRQALCRLGAIKALRDFKDPRVVEGLTKAYYQASSFPPDQISPTVIRCQALTALGCTGNPAAIDLLVKVLKEPPVDGPEVDRQQKMDERLAAAHALGNFKNYQATDALLGVMKAEQDVALRDRAHESLIAATGRHLPRDPQVWDDFLHQTGKESSALAGEPSFSERLREILPVNFWQW